MPDRRSFDGCGCGLPPMSIFKKKVHAQEIDEKHSDVDKWNDNDFMEEETLRGDSYVDPDAFQQMPPESTLNELYKVHVMDKTRRKVPFKHLVRSSDNRRHIVVFIRHFFCSMCYGYVKALSQELPPERLAKLNPPTKLVVIGCGDPVLIPKWLEQTECPYEVYADPLREAYTKLGFAISLAASPTPPSYVQHYSMKFMPNLWRSLKLTAATGKVSGGVISQNGGEMVWVDGQLRHMHRMKHSTDHMEVPELLRLLRRQGAELAKKASSVRSSDTKNNEGTSSKRNSWAKFISKRLSWIPDKEEGQ